MACAGPMSSAELAKRTQTTERYVREWLRNQAAGGYVTYDPATQGFTLPDEQAMALAVESSPVYLQGAFQVISSVLKDEPKVRQAFRNGNGVAWSEHDPGLFEGTERFFRLGYRANLVSSWIPALDGVEAKLRRGARVADVGRGHGASTLIMAEAFPKSTFIGYDYHESSIAGAHKATAKAGLDRRVTFEVASSTDFPGNGFQLVACFDCLHDMGDPVGAARPVRGSLTPDGTWLIVEPFAEDEVEKNLNPVGWTYYAASTLVCVPASMAHGGPALGAQAGETRLREVVMGGGITRFRRATQTPFNLILEARP